MASKYLTDAMVERALGLIAEARAIHGDGLVASTSFGIQAAVTLDFVTRAAPGTRVVFADTGYLPEETHRFAEELTERLDLDLHVARADESPAAFEARHGRLWETGRAEDLALYHRLRKTEPMQALLDRLGATAWIAGLRAAQSAHRATLSPVTVQWGRVKLLPILDWDDRATMTYVNERDLPMHPLFYEGYRTVGDWHSSRPVTADDTDVRATRFGGLSQECGLHLAS